MPGMIQSRLWRLRSTIQRTLPRPWTWSSKTASQTLPSSSSASPISAMYRLEVMPPKWSLAYRATAAEKAGATAPSPTDPVEKSMGSWSLDLLGYAWMPLRERSSVRYFLGRLPSRYCTAWKAGEAWGLTATRSPGCNSWKYKAVRMEITELEEAW